MATIKERIQLYHDAVDFKKTSRIPTFSNYWTFMVLDQGYDLSKALYDNDLLADIICKFHEKYEFDAYNYTGSRNPFLTTEAVNGNPYTIDDSRGAFNIADYQVLYGDEYLELAKNPMKFLWETVLPRKCKTFGEDPSVAIPAYQKSIEEYQSYMAMLGKINKKFVEDYQVPFNFFVSMNAPIEIVFNQLRGIKETGADLRRRPEQLMEALKALDEFAGTAAGLRTIANNPMPDNAIYMVRTVFLAHSVMSPKQYGTFYFPWVKQMLDVCQEHGEKMHIFCEAEFLRFKEFFQDVPKGLLVVQPEIDDVFEFRKALPNIAINGGMRKELLGKGTKEDCLDFAKKLVDEIGRDGGFIMGQDKMMTYRNDAKPENMLAVQEFCRTYKG